MLVACGAIVAAASLLAYRYLRTQTPPELRVPEDPDPAASSSGVSSQPQQSPADPPNVPSNHDEKARNQDGTLDPESPDTTPKQKPQPDHELMPPPPLPGGLVRASGAQQKLMAPPPRPNPNIPRLGQALQPPPSAASALRAPQSRQARPSSSLAPSTSTLPPKSRPSRKVLLAPGHSPLDWANLTRNPPSSDFLRGSDVPEGLIKVTPRLLKAHNGRHGTNPWGVFGGKVYNMGPYLDFHPGGVDQLMRGAGNDKGEKLFMEAHPWVNWDNMLAECCIGILISEDEERRALDKMDEMD